MIPEIRKKFNKEFTLEKYEDFKQGLKSMYNHKPNFREAETPFFIPKILKDRLLEACEEITDLLLEADLKKISQGALYDPSIIVPNENEHTTFLQMDFGVSLDAHGHPYPQLIEIQGFPSVYFFQYMASKMYKIHYDIPSHLTPYFNGYDDSSYIQTLRDIIIGDTDTKNVVILEIEPELQNTYIDLLSTSIELGIPVVCVTKVIKKGNQLFYEDSKGDQQRILKIYNRVIFDELHQRDDLVLQFSFTDELDVKWIGHPNWFYRISKYIMPILKSRYVPETHYLKDLKELPADLENFVLKPLFSFAGAGVIIDVTEKDITEISDPSNYILQRKVIYEPVIESVNDPVKVEIRMLMLWPDGDVRPHVAVNLVRLSKGKMIGVKFNKDKDWVGGSVGLYEGE